MKVFFATRSKHYFSHYQTVLAALCARGHEIGHYTDMFWNGGKIEKFGIEEFEREHKGRFSSFPLAIDGYDARWLTHTHRHLASLAGYFVHPERSEFFTVRWAQFSVKNRLSRPIQWLQNTKIVKWICIALHHMGFFALMERLTPIPPHVLRQIEEAQPDIVIVTPGNMRFSNEVDYIKAARKLGIPSAVLTLTWDSLSTKGTLCARPDMLFCWNEMHHDEARRFHGIPDENISVAGATIFEKWMNGATPPDNAPAFPSDSGLDPQKPTLMYLGSSRNIARDDAWLAREIHEKLRELDMQLIVRPHPKNDSHFGALDGLEGLYVWPSGGEVLETPEWRATMRRSFKACIGVVGINTSALLDAIILDVPCIVYMTEEYRRTQEEVLHFQALREDMATIKISDAAELTEILPELADGIDKTADARKEFVGKFIFPGGASVPPGEFIVGRLEDMCAEGIRSR